MKSHYIVVPALTLLFVATGSVASAAGVQSTDKHGKRVDVISELFGAEVETPSPRIAQQTFRCPQHQHGPVARSNELKNRRARTARKKRMINVPSAELGGIVNPGPDAGCARPSCNYRLRIASRFNPGRESATGSFRDKGAVR